MIVMVGLVPTTHAFGCVEREAWMLGTRPSMTAKGYEEGWLDARCQMTAGSAI